jgi:hypothetical protein
MPVIDTGYDYHVTSSPSNGVSAVHLLTIGGAPTGGTFNLKFGDYTTAAITWSATNGTLVSNVDTALEALPNIGTGGVTVAVGTMTNGVGTLTITFGAALAKLDVPLMTVTSNNLEDTTPPTIAVEETTAGDDDPATNEVQTLTIAAGPPTGGTFQLEFDGQTTGDIAWSSTNATLVSNVDTALEALSNIGAGNVAVAVGVMTAGIGTLTITFGGTLAATNVATITVADNSLTPTPDTVAVTSQTLGVTATIRNAAAGARLLNEYNGRSYVNVSATALNPVWLCVDE